MYQWASVILAVVLYVPLGRQLVSGLVTQNLATFILWGSLDAIVGASMYVQGSGNFQLPFAYVLGCIFIISCILRSGNYSWTKFETKISLVVAACCVAWCVIVWGFDNPWLATVLSTIGVVAAGIPQLRDSWREPESSPLRTYVGFTVVNILSTMAGLSWTVEERLYPVSCAILCGAVVLASMRKSSEQAVVEV